MTQAYVREDRPKKTALAPLYRGPYLVLRQLQNTVRLRMVDEEQTVSLAWIKPCWTSAPVLAEVPKRGRPAGGRLKKPGRIAPAVRLYGVLILV